MELSGRTFIYTYENGLAFRTQFPSGGHVKWECIAGAQMGARGEGPATITRLGSGRYFLHWIESDGLAVSQVADTDASSIVTSLVFPRGLDGKGPVEGIVLRGKIAEITT